MNIKAIWKEMQSVNVTLGYYQDKFTAQFSFTPFSWSWSVMDFINGGSVMSVGPVTYFGMIDDDDES